MTDPKMEGFCIRTGRRFGVLLEGKRNNIYPQFFLMSCEYQTSIKKEANNSSFQITYKFPSVNIFECYFTLHKPCRW